jgi:hypothetical protein
MKSEKTITMVIVFGFAVLTFVGCASASNTININIPTSTHTLSVPLTINETAGIPRFDEPVTSGVPIPRDLQLTNLSTLCLLDANGTAIPVQFTPLARWGGAPDNYSAPVKWLLLDFQTDIPAEGMVCYYLRNTADTPPAYPALNITDGVDAITVDTGTAIFSLNKTDGCLSAPGLVSPIYGRLHEPGGGNYTTTGPVTVSIALNGTMRASLKVQGAYCNETGKVLLNYTNRYWFYAGQSIVHLFHTVENNNLCPLVEYEQPDCYDIGSGGSVNLTNLSLIVPTNISAPINYYVGGEGEMITGTLSDELVLYQDSSGTDHWDCYPDLTDGYGNPQDTRPRMQSYVRFRGYRISLGGTNISSGDHAPGWMCISDSDADSAWCVAVRDFWQNFPKALCATPTGTLEIGLFPDEFGPANYSFNLRAGEHKTHEILLYPHDTTSGVPAHVRTFNEPLFARAPAEWYVNSGAFCLTAVRNVTDWHDHEHYVDYQLTTSPDYEEWMDWYPNLLVAIENTDFYGIFDYGDWPIDYEGYGVAPLNTKYDNDYGMLLQWARGGDHRWFRLAEAADRHLADVDILHNLHSPRHWGDGIAFGHSYHDEDGFINPHRNYGGNHPDTAFGVTGMLFTYYLTGYEKAYESVLELADCIEYRLHNDEHLCDFFPDCNGMGYVLGDGMYNAGCRPAANSLSIAVAAYRATADPRYLAVADAVVDWASASDQPYINGTTGEDQMMRPWMLNMYLHALANYLEMRGEFRLPDTYGAGGSLLAYADWLRTYAWLDLTPIDTGSRAAYPYEWWFDGRNDNNDPSICNWLLLGADAMAYAHRISGEDDYLEWATRLFRTGSRDPWFEGDANTYSATKETVNGITFGHIFLHEWAQKTATASTYYVAPTGDDFNPGTIDQPWRTIQHAVENVVLSDTIYVRDGTYNEWISISNSGLPGQPITLRSYPNETVILNGSGLEWRYGIDIGGADYWTFQDLIIQDYIREGLRGFGFVSWSGSKGITIRNLDFSLVGTPIKFHEGGEDILIEDIYAHDYDNGGFDCGPAGPCSNLTIRHFTALGPGTGDDTGVDGFAVEEGSNVLVEDCIAEGHPGDGFDFKSDNTTLRRVISRYNARNNIKLWGQDSRLENGLSHDSGLTNLVLAEGGSYTVINSLIANRDTYGYLAVVGYDQPLDTPLRLHNTIFYNDNPPMGGTTLYLGEGVHLTADHNIYYNPYREEDVICAGFLGGQCFSKDDINDGTWFNASGCGEHSIYAEPLFVNPATQDYHLTVESPAIDAGTVEDAPLDDLDGNNRPQGDGYDIGPYEYVEGENKTPIASFTFSPEKPVVNQTIIFNASNSTDPDGFITKYKWVFGDGTNGTGELITHSYSSVGNYTVNLTVTDDDGATNATAKMITGKVHTIVYLFILNMDGSHHRIPQML